VHVGLRGSVNICHKLLSLESSPAQGACVFQTGIIQIGDDRDKGLHHTHTHTHTQSHPHTHSRAHTHFGTQMVVAKCDSNLITPSIVWSLLATWYVL
jgi:hypothetical protein